MRRIFGDELDPALRPIVFVMLLTSMATSALYAFVGIWAIRELHAGESRLSVAYLVSALLGVGAGYVGGHLSDHHGRRLVMLLSSGLSAVVGLGYLLSGDHVYVGLGVFLLAAAFQGLGRGSNQAMVMDAVPPEGRERGFAAMRVAFNLGVTVGPAIGGAFLAAGWTALFVGQALMAAAAWVVAWRFIPRRGRYSPDAPPARGSMAVIARDRVFLAFCFAVALSWIVYCAYETLLPISLTDDHGISPSTWGLLVVINPVVVTLFQIRLTRWAADVRTDAKLAVAMLMMGLPFLCLAMTDSLLVIIAILLLFVLGEMLWVPAAQAVVARIAPDDLRGAYMGAYSGMAAIGFAVAPFVGLQVRALGGDLAMWVVIAAFSVVAAAILVTITRLPAVAARARDDARALAAAH